MTDFVRSFPLDALAKWDAQYPGNVVRSLFERWAFPGEKATRAVPLRLGVRDGYVNFYVKGQSVAELSCGRDGPRLSVHQAYVSGRVRTGRRDSVPREQGYDKFDANALTKPATATLISRWVETAETYASAEKRFVDDLVASNPGIIDLEMGSPAGDEPDSARVAPRMDLAAAQVMDGLPSIAFWEAKCAINKELRSSKEYEAREDGGFSGSTVLDQVREYVDWMEEGDRIAQVRKAYKDTAALLLEFHRLFGNGTGRDRLNCVTIWQALAEAKETHITVQPGVVIGTYWPEGYNEEIASGRMRQAAESFARDGHRDKLQRNGIRLFEVDSEGASLPRLPIAEV